MGTIDDAMTGENAKALGPVELFPRPALQEGRYNLIAFSARQGFAPVVDSTLRTAEEVRTEAQRLSEILGERRLLKTSFLE